MVKHSVPIEYRIALAPEEHLPFTDRNAPPVHRAYRHGVARENLVPLPRRPGKQSSPAEQLCLCKHHRPYSPVELRELPYPQNLLVYRRSGEYVATRRRPDFAEPKSNIQTIWCEVIAQCI